MQGAVAGEADHTPLPGRRPPRSDGPNPEGPSWDRLQGAVPQCVRPTSMRAWPEFDGRVTQGPSRAEIREPKRANEILKRAASFFGAELGPPTQEIVAFIDANRNEFGVEPIAVLRSAGVSMALSTYYDAKTGPRRRGPNAMLSSRRCWWASGKQLPGLRGPESCGKQHVGRIRRGPRPGRPVDAGSRHRRHRRGKRSS